ncbi:MAG: CaiB/BaiF CoA-transferase family protein [Acidimicrobiales bacterium]|jgi:alpha-methylacyl-CoA racemase
MAGPLSGVRVIEIASMGPGPLCAMMLADLGADVVRIDRVGGTRIVSEEAQVDLLARGRRSIAVNLKHPDGVTTVLSLIDDADVLIEGFRPGTMERLGLGPDQCLDRNGRLVYGRMTGYGQDGPLSGVAGHDINYIAFAGVLAHLGPAGAPPLPPLALVGDFGGGGFLLTIGILAALFETSKSGKGQVVDAAMVQGAALLMTAFHAPGALGPRGTNLGDGAAYFYRSYECADGNYISVGSMEPQFHSELLRLLELGGEEWEDQWDRTQWTNKAEKFATIFKSRTRAQWCAVFDGTDACFAPVLTMEESRAHAHNRERKNFVTIDGIEQPAPAPRFSRTELESPSGPTEAGTHTIEILSSLGMSANAIAELLASGAVESKDSQLTLRTVEAT